MGEVIERWRQAQINLPRFLGSLLDNETIRRNPLACFVITWEIKRILRHFTRRVMWQELKKGERVLVHDKQFFYLGRVVRVSVEDDFFGEPATFPEVLIEGETEFFRFDHIEDLWADIRGKNYDQLELELYPEKKEENFHLRDQTKSDILKRKINQTQSKKRRKK